MPGRLEEFCLALTDNPVGLHFSGHGIKSGQPNIGDDFYRFPNDDRTLSHCLLFEKDDGDSQYVTPRMLSLCKSLKFVFMATCHSEFAGEIFKEAGVEHVICINKNYEISDQAAIYFSK